MSLQVGKLSICSNMLAKEKKPLSTAIPGLEVCLAGCFAFQAVSRRRGVSADQVIHLRKNSSAGPPPSHHHDQGKSRFETSTSPRLRLVLLLLLLAPSKLQRLFCQSPIESVLEGSSGVRQLDATLAFRTASHTTNGQYFFICLPDGPPVIPPPANHWSRSPCR